MTNFWSYARKHKNNLFVSGSKKNKFKETLSDKKIKRMLKKERREFKHRILIILKHCEDKEHRKTLISLYNHLQSRILTWKQKSLVFQFEKTYGILEAKPFVRGSPPETNKKIWKDDFLL